MNRTTLRREMIGDWELSLIEFTHPADASIRVVDFKARMRLPNGGFTREVGDSTRGFDTDEDAWEAGKAFVAEQQG